METDGLSAGDVVESIASAQAIAKTLDHAAEQDAPYVRSCMSSRASATTERSSTRKEPSSGKRSKKSSMSSSPPKSPHSPG